MRIGAIVQARMGSTRLAGKVLLKLGDKTVLEHVVDRLELSEKLDEIIIATTESVSDDAIASLADKKNWKCFRGSENDVLSRYYLAAKEFNLDIVVRVTSDCPLIDWEIIDAMIELYAKGEYELVTNAGEEIYRTFPRGMDAEIFSFEVLESSYNKALEPYQKEHVTPYVYENCMVHYFKSKEDNSCYRLTLDTQEDFALINEIYKELYFGKHDFGLDKILKLLHDRPELYDINKMINQKLLVENMPLLRRAVWEDRDFLFELANDPEVRRNSFSAEKIAYDDHLKWYRSKLESDLSKIFICELDGQRAGLIRLDLDSAEKKAKISFSVEKTHRGMGIGTFLLEAIKGKNEKNVLIYGEVKNNNIPSQKVFKKAGYVEKGKSGHFVYSWQGGC